MKEYLFCGKGGVGKTTCAASLAAYLASLGEKTALLDYDGGHSVRNTLGMQGDVPSNVVKKVSENLHVAVVENTDFVGILDAKQAGKNLKWYLDQFPGDLGIVPLADMVNSFFGVPADIPTLQKFTMLVILLKRLASMGFDNVIIDVEPTAGFERLLSNAEATVRSLHNLQEYGIMKLAAIGAMWPDIAGYLKSPYIKDAHEYGSNISITVSKLRHANYYLVCTPESGPISQTFEVRRIIEKAGGKVRAYIVNNMRGETHEKQHLALLKDVQEPVIKLKRRSEIHTSGENRLPILIQMGESIVQH